MRLIEYAKQHPPEMIKLEFSIDEVNQIMAALGNMPYVQVAALVDKIKSQAVPQLPAPKEDV